MSALYSAWEQLWGALVVRAAIPGPSPFWRAEVERFYSHPTARLAVWMVGRGGDKTRESVVMGLAETIAGTFEVPAGERHYFTHVSENTSEASKTLGLYEAYLRVLAVPFSRAGDTVELGEQPRGIRVLACRVGAVSGYRCLGWTADEAAKWDNDGSDPSAEVIASIRAMTVTHPGARGRMISSPLGQVGNFYETWAQGDTDYQVVGRAASWVANVGITEQRTRELERSAAVWSREYAAIPATDADEAFYPAALVDRATRKEPGDVAPEDCGVCVAAIDPSLGKNAFTLAVVGQVETDGRTKASVVVCREWRAPSGSTLDPAVQLERIADLVKPYGVTEVHTDQYHAESLRSIADRLSLGITIAIDKPTVSEQLRRYEDLYTRLSDDEIELPRDSVFRADMLSAHRVLTPSGFRVRLRSEGGRHADYCPSAILAFSLVTNVEPGWIRAMRKKREREEAKAELDDWRIEIREVRDPDGRLRKLENPRRTLDAYFRSPDGSFEFCSGASEVWKRAVAKYIGAKHE